MPESKTIAALLELALEMGHVIRQLDESGDHPDLWTHDGEYVPDKRFSAAVLALATPTSAAPTKVAEPVVMTDQDIDNAVHKAGGRWDGDAWVIEDADLYPFVRSLIAPAVAVAEPLTDAARDVLAERQRQRDVEGWHPEHDDDHGDGNMAFAAAAYASHAYAGPTLSDPLWNWTGWSRDSWKPKDKRHNLIRSGALILAEIERLDRAPGIAPKGSPADSEGKV